MPSVDRRDFLRHSFAVATSSYAVPSVLAGFFSWQDPKQRAFPTREELLRAAWQRAGEEGKPLLVLVVPDDPRDSSRHQSTLGALLNQGGPGTLREFAVCVVVCATTGEVQRVTGATGLPTQPLMLLIEFAETPVPPKVTSIEPALPEASDLPRQGGDYRQYLKMEEEWIHECNERITATLRQALHDDGNRLPELAERVRQRLPKESLVAVEDWLAGGAVPGDALLIRCASIVRAHARRRFDSGGSPSLDALAAAVERVLVRHRVPGSKWASTGNCGGMEVEAEAGEIESSMACGMGHLPGPSRRFLSFYTDS